MNYGSKDILGLAGVAVIAALIAMVFLSYTGLLTTAVTATNNVNAIITVPLTCYTIATTNAINFGTVSPSTTTGIQTVTISDTAGNTDSFPWISGGNWLEPGAPSTFFVTNTMYHNSISATFIALTDGATNTYALVKPSATTISNAITFEVTIPAQQAPGTYNQIIYVTDSC